MSDVLIYRIYDTEHDRYVRPSNSRRSIWENPGPVGSLINQLNDPDDWRGGRGGNPNRYERHVFELRRIK